VPGGFTLVDLVLSVGVLGMVVALAVPAFGKVNQASRSVHDMENARLIASIVQGAEAAGVNMMDPGATVTDIVRRLSVGVTATEGVFAGQTFQLKMKEGAIPGIVRFLRVERGLLVYVGP
jgi:Tfp pilus assembly protein FimT